MPETALRRYGNQQQEGGSKEQPLVGYIPEEGQKQAQQGIKHQDVTAPKGHQVQEANDQQDSHPPVEDAEAVRMLPHGVRDDDRKSYPEEE